jgi:hypothetical protein
MRIQRLLSSGWRKVLDLFQNDYGRQRNNSHFSNRLANEKESDTKPMKCSQQQVAISSNQYFKTSPSDDGAAVKEIVFLALRRSSWETPTETPTDPLSWDQLASSNSLLRCPCGMAK